MPTLAMPCLLVVTLLNKVGDRDAGVEFLEGGAEVVFGARNHVTRGGVGGAVCLGDDGHFLDAGAHRRIREAVQQ